MNPCGIFRMVEANRCTLLIDEIEHLTGRMRNEEFKQMLRGAYKKGAPVQRMIKPYKAEDHQPRDYATYSPKMLANISGMDDTLEQRCITIRTQRSPNKAITRTEVQIDSNDFQEMRDRQFVCMMQNWKKVRQAYAETIEAEGIEARNWELWRPIIALAQAFGGTDLANCMKILALECIHDRKLDNADTVENILIESLLVIAKEDRYYALAEIKKEFASHIENGTWVTERYVGRLLRTLGFNEKRRINIGFQYRIQPAKVEQLAQSYGITINEDSVESVVSSNVYAKPIPEEKVEHFEIQLKQIENTLSTATDCEKNAESSVHKQSPKESQLGGND